jgi:putative Holliday junction resolvase
MYTLSHMIEKTSSKILKNKKIGAVDYGQKYTGLAFYHEGRDPYPVAYDRIKYINDSDLVKKVCTFIDDEVIEVIVVGVPFFTDGSESKMTKVVRNFIELLKKNIDIDVYEQDETLTTYEAEERMKTSPQYNFRIDYTKIDALSASIILEDFLKRSQDF